jgi:uncharacterized protein YecE (DUF72 family)
LIKAGTFYPPQATTAEARLHFYSDVFPTVEVDSSYYAMPSAANARLWAERTPPGFTFHVKAFRLFTFHWTEPKSLPKDLRPIAPLEKDRFYFRDASQELRNEMVSRFNDAIAPLSENDRLGIVLLQFPKWVTPRPDVFDHILWMQSALEGRQVAVEFRNKAWLKEERVKATLKWLEDNKLSYVCVDEPQGFPSSVPPVAAATTDVAYVRFHGRNHGNWEKPGQATIDRFDWYYKDEELQEWMPRIRSLQEEAREVHLLFNTNKGDQGPYNAIKLGRMLGDGLGDEDVVRSVERRVGLAAEQLEMGVVTGRI